jgi:hypothetical protein
MSSSLLRRYRYGPFGMDGEEWFVLTDPPDRAWPYAICLTSKEETRRGKKFGMTKRAETVPEDEVPDHVWAALAAWRLTQ